MPRPLSSSLTLLGNPGVSGSSHKKALLTNTVLWRHSNLGRGKSKHVTSEETRVGSLTASDSKVL